MRVWKGMLSKTPRADEGGGISEQRGQRLLRCDIDEDLDNRPRDEDDDEADEDVEDRLLRLVLLRFLTLRDHEPDAGDHDEDDREKREEGQDFHDDVRDGRLDIVG